MTVLESKQDTPKPTSSLLRFSLRTCSYATDFSATSEAALLYATALCAGSGAPCTWLMYFPTRIFCS